jgi:hypothetical protein
MRSAMGRILTARWSAVAAAIAAAAADCAGENLRGSRGELLDQLENMAG